MDQEIILTKNQIQKLPVANLTKRTLSILVSNDHAGKAALVKHYTTSNLPNFTELLKTPDRIPCLANTLGMAELGKILMAEITKFVNCYTIVRPMSADQIAQCAYAIIATSEEDYLSLQDLVLFFEGAKQGKYGRVLDHIDQHVIFEMLDQYREQRHRAYLNIKIEKEGQYKTSLTATGRTSDERIDQETDIRKEMVKYYGEQVQKNAQP